MRFTLPPLTTFVFGLLFSSAPSAQVCPERMMFTAMDGSPDDHFGDTLVLQSGRMAVGAHTDDDFGLNSGSVYLLDSSSGAQIAKLNASDGAAFDLFGFSLAMDDELLVVGAVAEDEVATDAGAVYLFDLATGSQLAKLVASDGNDSFEFGWSVALGENAILVGAPRSGSRGAVYVFDRTTLTEIQKLVPATGGVSGRFGHSVAIEGNSVLVGASQDRGAGFQSGAAYIFDASTWVQQMVLRPNDGHVSQFFGAWVDMSMGTAVIAAPGDDDNGTSSGAAYLFDMATGTQGFKLLPTNGEPNDLFAFRVAIDGDTAVVGAWLSDELGVGSGSAYVFDATTGSELTRLLPSDGSAADGFGRYVEVHEDEIFVGASLGPSNAGAVYAFDRNLGAWSDLGHGLAGVQGVPLLTGCGSLGQPGNLHLRLTGAAPNALVTLILGRGEAYLRRFGGVLVPTPDLRIGGLSTDFFGELSYSFPIDWPPQAGFPVVAQFWIQDTVGPHGFAVSNGLRIETR